MIQQIKQSTNQLINLWPLVDP